MKVFTACFYIFVLVYSGSAKALDCQNQHSQADMSQCAGADLDRETKRINEIYNKYRAKLNISQKEQFKQVQLAWIKFKDLACQYEASGVEGGSAYSMVVAGCLIQKTQQRNKELELLNNCIEGDLNCPAW